VTGDGQQAAEEELKVTTKHDKQTFKVDKPQNTKGSKNMIRDSLSKTDSGQR
jgi:hypothetical protein